MIKRAHLAFLHDLVMAAFSVPLAFFLRMGFEGFVAMQESVFFAASIFVLVAGITFQIFGMYRGIWRYASIPDLMTITKAASFAVLLLIPVMFQFNRLESFPRSFPVIQLLVLLPMLGGPRLLYRMFRDHRFLNAFMLLSKPGETPYIPILLVGTDSRAELFIRAVNNDPYCHYTLLGILDGDGKQRKGRSIHGVQVLGSVEEFKDVLAKLKEKNQHPQRLVFTQRFRQDKGALSQLARDAEKLGLLPSYIPEYNSLENAGADVQTNLKPIAIEDLLGRAQAPLDLEAICSFVQDSIVMVTGAGGSIGSELVRQICAFSPEKIILLDNGEFNLYQIDHELQTSFNQIPRQTVLCDIRNIPRLQYVFENERPDIVFHAAALKHVPLVELNPAEGILTNIIGTRNVADMAAKYKVKAMVQVSTDKAVNPTNIMGACKRLGEFYCQALDLKAKKTTTRFMTVRFGNVLGSSGSVVPLFRRQLAEGGPLTVTHPEICRYFMTVREAVGLILQASAYGIANEEERGQIFVLDMGEPVKILDIARKMIRLANLEPDKDISIVFTGLRPGEKLFEELFDKSEAPIKTDAPGILAAVPQAVDVEILRKNFKTLEKAAIETDVKKIISLIDKFVPGFTSEQLEQKKQNSSFEQETA